MSQIFYTKSGKTIIAGEEIGRGGEGTILEIRGEPSRCAKIYGSQGSETTLRKLSVMIANPPADPAFAQQRHQSIAWPEEVLFRNSERTAFAGFLMPRVDAKAFRTALSYLDPGSRSKNFGGSFNWKYLYRAAINVASSVGALHEKGYCIGDLNESNLLIAANSLITIIDCDSFQVPDPATGKTYRCLVGKPEYTAPELQGRYGEMDRTLATDRFALGVLLFQLLMDGTHPYQARGEAVEDLPSTQQKILKGLFPYAPGVRGVTPPAFALPFDVLDPKIQKLFLRCFVKGHRVPTERPSAPEWFETLRSRESLLQTCRINKNHVYFSHLKRCPWCDRVQTMGVDSFPQTSLGIQVALDDPAAPLASLEDRLAHFHSFIDIALVDGVITSQERGYLVKRGIELQLTKPQIEKLIDEEIRKAGAQQPAASAPKLVVSKAQFEFQKVQIATRASDSFTLSNQGGGVLSGTLRPTKTWLACPTDIDVSKHVQDVPLAVDTSGLEPGFTDNAEIEIRSNGGNATLSVNLSVELPEVVLSRFKSRLLVGAAVVGAVFGALVFGVTQSWSLLLIATWVAGFCLAIAGFTVAGGVGCAGLVVWLFLPYIIPTQVIPGPLASGLVWSMMFGSAAQVTGKWTYKLRARGSRIPYPLLSACALQLAVAFGLSYSGILGGATASSTQAPAASFRVEVTGDRVNIRSQPSRNASVLLRVPRGAVLEADATSGEWFRVKLSNGSAAQGWVHQGLVHRLNDATTPTPTPAPTPTPQPQATATPEKTQPAAIDAGHPPPLPFKDDGACPFEGCVYRDWVARRELTVHQEPEINSPAIFTLRPGDVARAETGFVMTLECGEALAKRNILFKPRSAETGQTVYLLHYAGEGFYRVWFKGEVKDLEVAHEGDIDSKALLVLIKEPKVVWWVRIRSAEGRIGWTDHAEAFGNKDALAASSCPSSPTSSPGAEQRPTRR